MKSTICGKVKIRCVRSSVFPVQVGDILVSPLEGWSVNEPIKAVTRRSLEFGNFTKNSNKFSTFHILETKLFYDISFSHHATWYRGIPVLSYAWLRIQQISQLEYIKYSISRYVRLPAHIFYSQVKVINNSTFGRRRMFEFIWKKLWENIWLTIQKGTLTVNSESHKVKDIS